MNLRRTFSLISAIVVILSLLPGIGLAQPKPPEVSAKIETALLDLFNVTGTADFIVVMAEKADLSAAYDIKDWNARGRYVYDALTAVAEGSQAELKKLLDDRGLRYRTFFTGNELYVQAGDLATANALAEFPNVASIVANSVYYIDPETTGQPEALPDSPTAVVDWGITDTKADLFWAQLGFKGQGIVVANIDTGVQWNHPALLDSYKCGTDPSNPDCWSDPSNTCGGSMCDNNGHGTHTMGTMVANDDQALPYIAGMAPDAQWIACKGCETNSCSRTSLTACADWIVAPDGDPANRPHVVNNSWGGAGGDPWYQTKVQAWRAAGIFPAFSAGNDTGCGSLGTPGDYQESFGTTGHNATRAHVYAQGPSDFGHDPYTKPNITAPASSICSTIPGSSWSCSYSGTSMASPHTAGAVALLWSCNASLIGQMDATFEALQNYADPPDPASPTCGAPPDGEGTYEDGYGYLNILATGLQNCVSDWAVLNGTVSNALTAAPIAGATVTGHRQAGGQWHGTTNASGWYSFTLGAGTYTVEAEHPQYETGVVTNLPVPTDTIVTQNFALQPRGHLYGYVTDLNSGVPLEATVTVVGWGSTATNPADGFYEFYVDAGSYEVKAEATDYASQTVTINIANGQNLQQNFALLAAVAVVPDPIAITLEMGQTGTVASQMTNNMIAPYPFEFVEYEGGAQAKAGGGPDPFGYTFLDSNEPGGPRYDWIDATDGTALNLTDDSEANVTLPFAFDFYGVSSTAIRVGNNGGLLFGVTTGDLSNSNANLQTTTSNNLVVPFWDDIDADTGNVYYKVLGAEPHRTFVVEWYNRPHYSNIGNATFELVLYEGTNNIKYQYQDVVFGNASYDYGAGATVGIRLSSPNLLQYSYNQAVLQDGLAICFNYPGSPPCDGGDVPWFDTSIVSGTVPSNSTIGWTNALSATTAAGIGQPGVYNADLLILPTVDGLPSKQVGVVMTVLPSANFGQLVGTVTGDRPGGPLEADILIEATDGTTVALTTDPATGQYSYWLEQGTYDVSASAEGYVPQTAAVAIVGQGVTTQNFELALNSPEIVVSPPSLVHTLQFGQTGVQVLNIANDGLQPLDWELREANAPQAQVNDILLMADDVVAADWEPYRAALTAAGVSWDEWNLDTLAFPTAADLAPYSVLLWADESVVAATDAQVQIVVDWLNSGGKGLFVTSVDFLWDLENGTPGSGENNLYLMLNTTYQGDSSGTGITIMNGVAGDPIGDDFVAPNGLTLSGTADGSGDYANLASAATMGLIYGTGGSGSGYGGLSHYEGANYKTVWLGINFHNGLTLPAQRATLMENILSFLAGGGDVPWLSESLTSGTVQPGESIDVNVTFDASMVPEPGVYHAMLRAMSNDPLNRRVDIPVMMNVQPTGSIGKLEGIVTSDRPGGPLEAEVRIEASGGTTWTVPTDPDTGFYYKWLTAGAYDVTASAVGYIPQTTGVVIQGQVTTTQNFELVLLAPEIAVAPDSLEQTLLMGQTAMQTVGISNLGNEPLEFEITERDADYFPDRAGEDILVVAHDATAAAAMETALAALDYTFLRVTDAQFQAMTVDQLLEYLAVFHAGTSGWSGDPSASEILLVAYLDAGGSLFIADNDLGFYRHGSVFYDTYLQSTYNLDNAGDYVDGLDLMAGLTLDISADPYPDGITVGAEGTAIFQFQGSTEQNGAAVERNGYRAVYAGFDFHNIADPAQEIEVIDRVLGFIAVTDAPWLAENPTAGTVGAGGTVPVEVTFDAGVADQPGTYTAKLRIAHNDPLAEAVNVPVTLTVAPGLDYGRVEGVVSGLGYCDEEPGPLAAEVLIEAQGGLSWTIPSDPADGRYHRWLLAGTYTVTASADEHLPATAVVDVTAQQTTTQDLDLRYVESCLDVTPTSFDVTVPLDDQRHETLSIANDGAGELLWELHETTSTVKTERATVSIPRFTGTLPDDKTPVSLERAPAAAAGAPVKGVPLLNPGSPGYLMNLFEDALYYSSDVDAGGWTLVGAPGVTAAYSGDFGPDLETLYLISDDTKMLYGYDIASGVTTAIGPCQPISGQTWTGMAWDPTTRKMYGSATDGTTATLFTINLATGTATQVATITGAAFTIDIAIDDAGQMYGLDIALDSLVTIDKVTGATSVVGSIGFNANYAQGMDYDLKYQVLYLAGYDGSTSTGGMYVIDTATGAAQLLYIFPGGAEADALAIAAAGLPPWNDVPWVSEVPTDGVVLPDGVFDVDVVFDATGLTVGECYTATLALLHDDPGWDSPFYMPLTMCVATPCVSVTGVELTLATPQPIYEGDDLDVVVDLAPPEAEPPFVYSIDGGPTHTVSTNPFTVTISYSEPGTHTVEVAVWNCTLVEPVIGTVDVFVRPMYDIYLPLLSKQ